MPNIGEEDEIQVLKLLYNYIGSTVPCFGKIKNVADFRGNEFKDEKAIKKAPSKSKRDVIINGVAYSLKSTRAAPVAIVNHTTREKFLRVCNRLGLSINPLDCMVSEYWDLRIKKQIGEDVWAYESLRPYGNNKERKEYLKKIINYFMFEGTGKQDNSYPADYILEIGNPKNVKSWIVLNKDQAFDNMWPNIKFSMRSKKGMPLNYSCMSDYAKKKKIEPWVRYIDGDYRGALHIRASSSKKKENLSKKQNILF